MSNPSESAHSDSDASSPPAAPGRAPPSTPGGTAVDTKDSDSYAAEKAEAAVRVSGEHARDETGSTGIYPNIRSQDDAATTPANVESETSSQPWNSIGEQGESTGAAVSTTPTASSSDTKFWSKFTTQTPMRVLGRMMGQLQGLPKVRNKVHVTKRFDIPMRDGVKLAATLYSPEKFPFDNMVTQSQADTVAHPLPPEIASGHYPTILIRTPYNRKHIEFLCQRIAERGYYVVIQDTRGRCDSEGVMNPLADEANDGQDTITWIRSRGWFAACPKLAGWGMSYLGIVQYAMLPRPGQPDDQPNLDAIVPIMCSSQVHPVFRPGGGYAMGLFARWHYITTKIKADTTLVNLATMFSQLDKKVDPVFGNDMLVTDIDGHITGDPTVTSAMGDILINHANTPSDDPFWQERSWTQNLARAPPAHIIGAWHDPFLPSLIKDYRVLKDADASDRNVFLTIGPWTHFDLGAVFFALKEGLWWFENYLRPSSADPPPESRKPRLPCLVYVQGIDEWRGMVDFPPECNATKLFLRPHGRTSSQPPAAADAESTGDDAAAGVHCPTSYVYDPNRPTPNIGGADFHPVNAGSKSNRKLESRDDVVSWTSSPLDLPVEIIGPIKVVLYVKSSLEHTDFVVRLCCVKTAIRGLSPKMNRLNETSKNVCDGYVRVDPDVGETLPSGVKRIEIEMWPTAYQFKKGSKIRINVSSAAHPQFQRHPGSHEGLFATSLKIAQQQIYHDPEHQSHILLPITKGLLPT